MSARPPEPEILGYRATRDDRAEAAAERRHADLPPGDLGCPFAAVSTAFAALSLLCVGMSIVQSKTAVQPYYDGVLALIAGIACGALSLFLLLVSAIVGRKSRTRVAAVGLLGATAAIFYVGLVLL
jgi:hypothetical protein